MSKEFRVIHVPYRYYPDPVGGADIYAHALAHNLRYYGVQSIIAAQAPKNAQYIFDGIPVFRYALSEKQLDLHEIYGEGDPHATVQFETILDAQQPDLVHLHDFSSGTSLGIVRAVARRGIPVVFTYQAASITCLRGTLLHWGDQVCDGVLTQVRCTRCVLHGHGLNRTASKLLGTLPPRMSSAIGKWGHGPLWTALRMSELVALRHSIIHSLFDEVDHVVAVSHWIKDVLQRNGVPESKITVSRYGLAHPKEGIQTANRRPSSKQLRLIFLGRLDPIKGIDVIVRALQNIPNAPVQLDLYIVTSNTHQAYEKQLRDMIERDPRITWHPPLEGTKIISVLCNYDVLVVPSRCLETGPLVVLESFAAGIPVLGSNLGGIAEWVEDGVNGILVEPDSVQSWSRILEQLCSDKSIIEKLRLGINPPPDMKQVAKDMLCLYQNLPGAGKYNEIG